MKTFDSFDRVGGYATAADLFHADFQAGHRVQLAPWGGYAILGYRELVEIGRNHAADGMGPDAAETTHTPHVHRLIDRALFTKSGEAHRGQRAALVAAFNTVDAEQLVANALASVLPAGCSQVDTETELVRPLISAIWSGLLGLDAAAGRAFERAVSDVSPALSMAPDASRAGMADEAARLMRELAAASLKGPGPMPSALRSSLGDEVAADLIAGMAFDGIETASIGLVAALRVAAVNRALVEPTARCADECFRLASPTPMSMRLTTSEIVAGSIAIPAGTTLSMIWAAGNHDPAVFDRPGTFDPGRDRVRPIAFGIGAHTCLGHALMRIALRQVLAVLVDREGVIDACAAGWNPFAPLEGVSVSIRLQGV